MSGAQSKRTPRAVAELGVLLAMLIWAANFTVVKAAVTAWPVLPFSAIRITAAGLIVLLWTRLRGGNIHMSRRDLLTTGIFGIIGQGTYQLLWAGSLGTINAGTSALLIAVTPLLTA
ncbi:MAG: DMT family transporter, partial [Chloroflexota bacterium]